MTQHPASALAPGTGASWAPVAALAAVAAERCERHGVDCDTRERAHLFHVPVRLALNLPQVDAAYACNVPVGDLETLLALIGAASRLPQVRPWAVEVFTRTFRECLEEALPAAGPCTYRGGPLEAVVHAWQAVPDLDASELERVCAVIPGAAGAPLPEAIRDLTADARFTRGAALALIDSLHVWRPNGTSPQVGGGTSGRGYATLGQQFEVIAQLESWAKAPLRRMWAATRLCSGPPSSAMAWLWEEWAARKGAAAAEAWLGTAEVLAGSPGLRRPDDLRAAMDALHSDERVDAQDSCPGSRRPPFR